jgi:hypothetical protein
MLSNRRDEDSWSAAGLFQHPTAYFLNLGGAENLGQLARGGHMGCYQSGTRKRPKPQVVVKPTSEVRRGMYIEMEA